MYLPRQPSYSRAVQRSKTPVLGFLSVISLAPGAFHFIVNTCLAIFPSALSWFFSLRRVRELDLY